MLSFTKMLALDPFSPVGCGLCFQPIPQTLNWIVIWRIWRSRSTPRTLCHDPQTIPEQFYSLAGHIIPLKEAIANNITMKGCTCSMVQFWCSCANCRRLWWWTGISIGTLMGLWLCSHYAASACFMTFCYSQH